ncbi:hypothetical protein U717_05985 [Rhodobacter capsulatus R121]|nr:hypothetical protein U714_05980 [Rhodobacter capsulatus DE442]ETD78535.1 hypothetical protein U717_05985 [Rhodobacter capsulatus R121]ETE54580.1 hypothetical protein U715_05980 [Rhodobacter capsulatus Y262]
MNTLQQCAGGFVARVLWDEFATERFGEDGGIEFGEEVGGGGVVGGHAVHPVEGRRDETNDFGLLL